MVAAARPEASATGVVATLAVGWVAGAALGVWELCLARLCSLLYFFHITYMVLAASLLGLAVGSFWAGRWLQRSRDPAVALRALALLVPLAMTLSLLGLLQSDWAWGLGLFTLPFVVHGAMLPALYQLVGRRRMPTLYAFELLGLCAGLVVLGPAIVARWGAEQAGLSASVLATAAIPLTVWSTDRQQPARWPVWLARAAAVGVPAALLALSLQTAPGWLRAPLWGSVGLQTHLRGVAQREGVASIRSVWSAHARTDLLHTRDSDAGYVFTDAMFGTRIVTWDGRSPRFSSARMEALAGLQRLPLRVAPHDRVMVVGAGGGFGVALALQEGARHVDAIEVNAQAVAFAREAGASAGHIYDRPEVSVHIAEARHFARRARQRADQIHLTLVETAPEVRRGHSHVHARLLTVEAMRGWLGQTNPTGLVAVVQNTRDLALQSADVVAAALGPAAGAQMAMLHLPGATPATNPFCHLVLASPRPLSATTVAHIQAEARALGAHVDWLPGQPPAADMAWLGRPDGELHRPGARAAPTDDRPFFFQRDAGVTPWAALPVGAALLLLAVALARRRARAALPLREGLALAVAGSAAALVQVAVIYRAQGAVGTPSRALGAGLAALLVGAALGAWLWQRLPERARSVSNGAVAAALGCGSLWMFSSRWAELLGSWSAPAATAVTFGLIALHALPLGLPFVALLDRAVDRQPGAAGSVVAVDGLGTVLGAALATPLAAWLGYDATLATASAAMLLTGALALRPPRAPAA